MTLFNKHISQALIHLLFWMLFIFVSLFVFSPFYWSENPFLQYLSILVIIVYANNFLLLPFFVRKRMFVAYIFVFAIISVAATQLYCNSFARCGCSLIKCLSDYLWQTLVPLIFFSFVWTLYRFIDKQEEVEAVKQEHTEMELKFLKSQVNPHVLLNNLNTIYAYAIEKPDEVPAMILMLSENLKHVLYESDTPTIALEKEVQFIDNYMKFQTIRSEGVKSVDYSKNIDSYDHEIAPLLLITIIENAFKHSPLNGQITVDIDVREGVLECTCENSFIGREDVDTDLKIGLSNLEKRLKLLYKDRHELRIKKTDTFSVYLRMELT
jgi:sensor histidine kinase YesM